MAGDTTAGRTAVEWFEEAARCFVDDHQGCPSCAGQHCVFRSDWGERVEFYCSLCDFSVCQDRRNGSYVAIAGNETGDGSGVMTAVSLIGDEAPSRNP
jgi:hypothetical protein